MARKSIPTLSGESRSNCSPPSDIGRGYPHFVVIPNVRVSEIPLHMPVSNVPQIFPYESGKCERMHIRLHAQNILVATFRENAIHVGRHLHTKIETQKLSRLRTHSRTRSDLSDLLMPLAKIGALLFA